MKPDCDILIVGAGILGSSLALALPTLAKRIVLVEAATLSTSTETQTDNRPLALNYASVCILQKLGVWEEIEPYANPIAGVQISMRGRFAKLRITAKEGGVPVLGYVLTAWRLASILHSRLLKLAQTSASLTLYHPATLDDLVKVASGWEAKLSTATGHLTRWPSLVVAADGTQSRVKQLLKIATKTHDYAETAIVSTVYSRLHHCHMAYERFTEQGTIALLPLLPNQLGLVWTLPTRIAHEWFHWPEQVFLDRLQTAFGYRLGKFLELGQRHLYPLIKSYTEQPSPAGLVLLGNAAHTLHPIAAQGLNLSLQSLAALVAALTETTQNQYAIGTDCLQHHFHAGHPRQRRMLAFTDSIKTLFNPSKGLFALASQTGLLALDLLPWFKQCLIQDLMGPVDRLHHPSSSSRQAAHEGFKLAIQQGTHCKNS